MTALAGRVSLGGSDARQGPECERLVRAMLERMLGTRWPHVRFVTSGRASLARGFHASARPDHEGRRQALRSRDNASRILVIADARLDDDDAIDSAWREGVVVSDESPDEAAIRSAYLRWGDDCAGHLTGDYAFALYDPAQGKMLLARDLLGTRNLYYLVRGTTLHFASEAQALFADASLTAEPNLEAVARFLVNDYSDNGPTLLREVVSLMPGHTLVLDDRGARTREHAALEPVRQLSGLRDEDYAARVANALTLAVQRRIRRARGVGVTLSGGLDSSSIACLAERERRLSNLATQPVLALHSRYGELACDETANSSAVVRQWRLRAADCDALADSAWSAPSLALLPGAPLYYPSAFAFDAHFAAAAERGVDTVLTGEGGDMCLTRTPFDFVERVKAGDFRAVARLAFRPFFSTQGLRRGYDLTLRQAIPWRLRSAVHAWRTPPRDPILSERWSEAVALKRLEREVEGERTQTGDRRTATLVRWVQGSGQQFCTGRLAHFARRRGVTLEHPFLDAELVRLLLSLPSEQRYAPPLRKPKPVLRRAMRDVLPAEIHRRQSSAEYSSFVRACLVELHSEQFAAVAHPDRLIELGVVHPTLRLDAPDTSDLPLFYRKLAAIAMELWLRQLRP